MIGERLIKLISLVKEYYTNTSKIFNYQDEFFYIENRKFNNSNYSYLVFNYNTKELNERGYRYLLALRKEIQLAQEAYKNLEKEYNTKNNTVSGNQTVGHDKDGNGKTIFDYIENSIIISKYFFNFLSSQKSTIFK